MIGLVHLQNKLIYTAKGKKKEKIAQTFSYRNNVSMADTVAILFAYYSLFYPHLERNTLILHTLQELLYIEKKKKTLFLL